MLNFRLGLVLGVAGLCLAVPGTASMLRALAGSQLFQNRRADAEKLTRMRDVSMVREAAKTGLLVKVPSQSKHYYTRYIPADYSYLRPWGKLFLDELAAGYYRKFGKKLRVTSMVRTVGLQRRLAKRNGNAASAYGSERSSHLTGATMDISKKGMTAAEIAWMRSTLVTLKNQGYVYAIEEFQQPTFHIMIFRKYQTYSSSRRLTS